MLRDFPRRAMVAGSSYLPTFVPGEAAGCPACVSPGVEHEASERKPIALALFDAFGAPTLQ